MTKLTIDDEIKLRISGLNTRDDTHPDYLPPWLKDLQTAVLASHARLENGLETRMLMQIQKDINNSALKSALITLSIRPLFEHISFNSKVEIIKSYRDEVLGLIKSLQNANRYRNEFAHPDGYKLRQKFNHLTPAGKQNIRDLLRCLDQAEFCMDNYFIKLQGVPKMREKS